MPSTLGVLFHVRNSNMNRPYGLGGTLWLATCAMKQSPKSSQFCVQERWPPLSPRRPSRPPMFHVASIVSAEILLIPMAMEEEASALSAMISVVGNTFGNARSVGVWCAEDVVTHVGLEGFQCCVNRVLRWKHSTQHGGWSRNVLLRATTMTPTHSTYPGGPDDAPDPDPDPDPDPRPDAPIKAIPYFINIKCY